MSKNDSKVTRRDLLKSATIAGAGLSLSGLSFGKDAAAIDSEFFTGAKTNNQTVIGMKFEPRDVITGAKVAGIHGPRRVPRAGMILALRGLPCPRSAIC